jgi:3-phenylpropionate/cinnamic acid dioxygenase small subunit
MPDNRDAFDQGIIARLKRMESHAAISELLFLYAELLDAGDLTGVGQLFANAVVRFADIDLELRGAEAFTKFYEIAPRHHLAPGLRPLNKHVISNIIVAFDETGDRAKTKSYYSVFRKNGETPPEIISCGRYHDEFERVDGKWRFVSRLTIEDIAGNR